MVRRNFNSMSGMLAVLLIGFPPTSALSQAPAATYDCFYVKTVTVAHIRGFVVDQGGQPVRGAKVELLVKGANDALASQQSMDDGQFRFDEPGGKYWIHVKANGFEPAGLSVSVDRGFFSFLSFFNTRQLYVVLATGGNGRTCPEEITSKRQFREYVRNHAARK